MLTEFSFFELESGPDYGFNEAEVVEAMTEVINSYKFDELDLDTYCKLVKSMMSWIRDYLKSKIKESWMNETCKKHLIKIIGTIEELFVIVFSAIFDGLLKVISNPKWWEVTHTICAKAFDNSPGYITGIRAYAKKWIGCLFTSLTIIINEILRHYDVSLTKEEEDNLKNIISDSIDYCPTQKSLNLNDNGNNDKKFMLTNSKSASNLSKIEAFIKEYNLQEIVLAKTLIDAQYDDIEMFKVMNEDEIKDLCDTLNLKGTSALKLKVAIRKIKE